jgi:hypothetical protein
VYVKSYYKADSSIREFRIEQFEANELVYYLKANSAKWLPKKEKWRLNNYEIRKFNDMEEDFIIGRGKQMDTTINLRPADFVDYLNQHTMMNTPLLKSYIQKQKSRGVGNVQKYEIELYRRSAEPFTIIILTLIGVPIAARKVRGGLGPSPGAWDRNRSHVHFSFPFRHCFCQWPIYSYPGRYLDAQPGLLNYCSISGVKGSTVETFFYRPFVSIIDTFFQQTSFPSSN